MKYLLSVAFLASASGLSAIAQEMNWDQWRGPNKNGSVEIGNPVSYTHLTLPTIYSV